LFAFICLRQSPPCFDLYFCCVFLSLELMCQASALPCCLLCNFSDFWCLALFLPLLWVSHFYSRLFSFNRMLSQRVTQSHPTFISMPIVSSFFFFTVRSPLVRVDFLQFIDYLLLFSTFLYNF